MAAEPTQAAEQFRGVFFRVELVVVLEADCSRRHCPVDNIIVVDFDQRVGSVDNAVEYRVVVKYDRPARFVIDVDLQCRRFFVGVFEARAVGHGERATSGAAFRARVIG